MIHISQFCIFEVESIGYYVCEILKSFHFQSEKDKLTCWLHLSFPGIYGHVVERLNTPSFIFLLGRIIAVQASPNWPLIARLCLARDMEFVTLIMKNFGAFIPGIRGDNVNVRGLSRPCGHLMCSKRCVPVAGIHWPQVSYSKVSKKGKKQAQKSPNNMYLLYSLILISGSWYKCFVHCHAWKQRQRSFEKSSNPLIE